jgi:hypothetical protein
MIKGVHLTLSPFPEDVITPTLKIKRCVVVIVVVVVAKCVFALRADVLYAVATSPQRSTGRRLTRHTSRQRAGTSAMCPRQTSMRGCKREERGRKKPFRAAVAVPFGQLSPLAGGRRAGWVTYG